MQSNLISRAMIRDQHWLRQQSRKIDKLRKSKKPTDQLQAKFDQRLQESLARREQRDTSTPAIEFPDDLPITGYREDIISALREHQVIVVAGETGSGKSTQLPKICLDAGFGIGGMIGHTQPRRIAARSVAARIAEELKSPLGQAVGFKVRFDDKTDDNTYIKLMTDGILLAEAAGDRFLEQYEVIILDEAHERSLNIDFLLGMLHGLLQKRKDLRLIITSATIDAERFGEHFGTTDAPAPIITVEGRTYPVEVLYRPLEDEEGKTVNVYQGIIDGVHELSHDGDILVFLPTERDIREAAKRLRADKLMQQQQREILPLYARLSTSEQNKIFRPGAARRVVLATNVAESSLTVPRIHCVIDTGTARISRFSSRLRMQRLPIEPVSRASADQRKGRCGRLGPGKCIRLFSEEDFAARSEFTTPEIRRTNLASVILQAKHLRLPEVDKIPFLDPPRPETVREGYKTLFEIGAVDDHRRLTGLGRTLAKLPVDPRIGRMVLAGHEEHCLSAILVIAAALEIQDPRVRPIEHQQAADQQHLEFQNEDSDFLSYLALWDFVEDKRRNLSRSKFTKMCQQKFLSPARLREWSEIHRQLRQTANENGMKAKKRKDDADAIHRALLTGLLSCAAHRGDDKEYTGAGGNKFFLWPGSGLFASKPKWIMAAELVETSKRFGRITAKINPSWLEKLGDHLVKYSYSDPHWHAKSQSVMAFESVSLFGLPVVSRRRVPYGHLDVSVARQIFIERGLVAQEMESGDAFYRQNASTREQAAELAAKTRKRDFILDEYRVHTFYAERVPDDVYDMASLRRAFKKDPQLPQLLTMSIEDLAEDESTLDVEQFPPQLNVGPMRLPLTYHFEPGSEADGVTVTVPAEVVSQVHPERLDWLVPGLLEEKLIALIRSLPKAIRRALVPAPDTAAKVASDMEFGKGPFLVEVARHFSAIADEKITKDDFRIEKLSPHLQMRVRVVGNDGKEQSVDRDLRSLRSELAKQSPNTEAVVEDTEWHRDNVTSWDFGDLPKAVQVNRGGIEVTLYPAMVEFEDQTLGLRLEETETSAETSHRGALRRLYRTLNRKSLRTQVRWLPDWDKICLWSSSIFPKDVLEDQLALVIADVAFLFKDGLPRKQEDFEARQQDASQRIAAATQTVAGAIPEMMAAYHRVRLSLAEASRSRFRDSIEDIELQIARLTHPTFLSDTPWDWLSQYPRYLRAIEQRLEKLGSTSANKERSNCHELEQLWKRIEECENAGHVNRAALVEYRWMLEEYRVSLFAQSIGTVVKVSPQRLEKKWTQVHQ